VTAFADKFEKEGGDLHILVMNAAIALPDYQRTTDGWETMLVYFIFLRAVIAHIYPSGSKSIIWQHHCFHCSSFHN
jgi:NAD(P)-dependent dehydrogenase (short-subunit alcohol dehydrogenase family)